MIKIQNKQYFLEICDWCVNAEPKLKPVISKFNYPPFWHREPNFSTLILTILEQQVSLASAKSAYNKLVEKTGLVTPESFIKLSENDLKACYFSRQKIVYTKNLAHEILSGKLDLNELNNLTEQEIRSTLIKLKGIGNWTIEMYLLMSLHFADIFPPGDLATIKSVYELDLVPSTFSKEEIVNFMKKFSPFQSVATYILWHSYIEKRKLKLE